MTSAKTTTALRQKPASETKAKLEASDSMKPLQVEAWTAKIQGNIQREMENFQRILPELEKTQLGKFVAISDGKLIGADANEHELVKKVSKENRGHFILIQEVTAQSFRQSHARL